MPSYSQKIDVNLNSNENGALNNEDKTSNQEESKFVSTDSLPNSAPVGLSPDQLLAFALRDFLGSSSTGMSEQNPSPSTAGNSASAVGENKDDAKQSEEEQPQSRETDEVLNNAACRLRRWRAASRKLRRPRIINNLSATEDKEGSGSTGGSAGYTDLADRLRSLAAAGSMSASAGELLSLAPPPPAATAPPSPGCLLSPTLADQSSAEYFVSTPSNLTFSLI